MAENQKYLSYFKENTPEDLEDVMTICSTASKTIWDHFRIKFDDPELLGAVFSKIYEAFIKYLVDQESKFSDFQIDIAGRLSIGYTTTSDEDEEKQGNFMISIKDLNSNKKYEGIDDPTVKAVERAVHWNSQNVINQTKTIQDVSLIANELLKDIDVSLGSSELVMPIFVTTYECLVNYLKVKRREKNDFEFEINFISCFYIGARESEEDFDDIYIRPNINSKLMLKNDSKASSQFE